MSIDLRPMSVLIMGGILLGFLGGCQPNEEVDTTESARAADAGNASSSDTPAASSGQTADATPAADSTSTQAPASTAGSMVIFADCEAPHRWTWGWKLDVQSDGKAEVQLKPDAYGEEVFEEFKVKPDQMNAIKAAAMKADFFNLKPHYGQAEGPVTRTLRLTIDGKTHETKFTARHTQLDGIPIPLLELWCQIRETFDTYRAHNGAEYIRQYLENRENP